MLYCEILNTAVGDLVAAVESGGFRRIIYYRNRETLVLLYDLADKLDLKIVWDSRSFIDKDMIGELPKADLEIEFSETVDCQKLVDMMNLLKNQLNRYFDGELATFDIPIIYQGTEFQIAAWKAMGKIGYGETITYKEQATLIGNINASRAVGNANNKNCFVIVVPCHRVVAANGIGGYYSGFDKKQFLLSLESKNKVKFI